VINVTWYLNRAENSMFIEQMSTVLGVPVTIVGNITDLEALFWPTSKSMKRKREVLFAMNVAKNMTERII